ncbi:hypothetical protein Ancab_037908 [Ancistrocladus abbreviatus]
MAGCGGDTFSKTICAICYEDLKPIVEDLQVISICGHVFHELCLQEWFEYCTNAKRQKCPICKQICSSKNVSRLYFQSLGNPNDQVLSRSQNVDYGKYNPEVLRREVRKLESKVSGFDLVLERHQREVKELREELCVCKERLTNEVILKNEALKHNESVQEMLVTKSSELVRSTLECSRLQERNLALAKDLAALKLISDCSLEEDDILMVALLDNEANSKDAVDILKKSLVIRNKNYKELMAKCNTLGRRQARSFRKLERAKEKITKLKTLVQELEIALEAKVNEVQGILRASKTKICNNVPTPSVNKSANCSPLSIHLLEDQKEQPTINLIDLDEDSDLGKNACGFGEQDNKLRSVNNAKDDRRNIHCEQVVDFMYLTDEDAPEDTRTGKISSKAGSRIPTSAGSNVNEITDKSRPSGEFAAQGSTGLLLQDIRQVQPSLHARKEMSSAPQLSEPGNRCFAGGLLGPDGATRYLGKWCKRAQSGESKTSPVTSGSLVAAVADGRGGQIKVLRLQNLSVDGMEGTVSAKKCKLGRKTRL